MKIGMSISNHFASTLAHCIRPDRSIRVDGVQLQSKRNALEADQGSTSARLGRRGHLVIVKAGPHTLAVYLHLAVEVEDDRARGGICRGTR